MSKLIYVDRLKKDILDLPNCYNGFSDTFDKACIIGVIDEQPTVEERKVGMWIDVACPNCGCKIHIEPEHKPAHWIVYEVANTEEEQPIAWQCPNCDEVVDCKYNFCPECGQEFEVNT